jgi:hypothetical protein
LYPRLRAAEAQRPQRWGRRLELGGIGHQSTTILRPHDFVVIVRATQRRGSLHFPGPWTLAGIAESAPLADAMAGVLRAAETWDDVRVVSHWALFRRLSGAEREQILELLDTRTTADIARSDALREVALGLLDDAEAEAADAPLTRSGSVADYLAGAEPAKRTEASVSAG